MKYLIGLWICITLFGCRTTNQDTFQSLINISPVVIEENGAEIFQYWEFKNTAQLWGSDPGLVKELDLYKDSLLTVLGRDTLQKTVQKESPGVCTFHYDSLLDDGDKINAGLVHSGQVGHIRAMNFLESELLNYQLNRYPLLSHPTEFHGFILLQDSLKLVRVYFTASDQPWPPKPKVILEAIKQDLLNGWKLQYHLHNHYEPKSNNYVGILAPSLADAQYYMFLSDDYGLEWALITNGFNTVEIKKEEFPKFKMQSN